MQTDKESLKIQEGFLGQRMIVIPPIDKALINENSIYQNMFLTAIGYYPKADHHDRKRETGADQYILLYCVSGKGTILTGGDTYILKPNQYFILPKHQDHHYYTSKDDPWSIYWVHYDGIIAKQLYEKFQHSLKEKKNTVPFDNTRVNQFNSIYSIIENSFQVSDLELAGILLNTFLASFLYGDILDQSNNEEDQISEIIKFMKQNLDKNFTIEKFANEFDLSVSRYSEMIKKKTGFSPIHYFNNLRINQSCQYLYFTELSIKEICSKTGFNDPYYFSRLFKKLMGVSPNTYRNNCKRK